MKNEVALGSCASQTVRIVGAAAPVRTTRLRSSAVHVVVVVFTSKIHPGLVSIQYLLLSPTSISVLILSLNTVNFRGHKLTDLKKVYREIKGPRGSAER